MAHSIARQSPQLPPANQSGSSLSFAQGFLLGQLSIALLIFCFIKFFIFGEPPSANDRALRLSSLQRFKTSAHPVKTLDTRANSTSLSLRHKPSKSIIQKAEESRGGPSIATILAKTYYNVKGHLPESLDWFNVLVAQTIAQLRADARQDDAILVSLTEAMNSGIKPDWIGEIRVTEIALGDEFPIFSNCRVMPAEDGSWRGPSSSANEEARLQARMDVDLSDIITIGIETTLNLNWPKPLSAVLPVALAVSIVRFSGTLAVSFIPSSSSPIPAASPIMTTTETSSDPDRPSTPSNSLPHRPTTLAFTFLDDYCLDLSVRSLVGSRSRLQDVPKIAQLIESRVHAWFDERAVEPRFQEIVLPSLWPRKHNTRGPSATPNAASGDEGVDVSEEDVVSDHISTASTGTTILGPPFSPPPLASGTLEARFESEGAKLRDVEIRTEERRAQSASGDGVRRRREDLVRPRLQKGMRNGTSSSSRGGAPGG